MVSQKKVKMLQIERKSAKVLKNVKISNETKRMIDFADRSTFSRDLQRNLTSAWERPPPIYFEQEGYLSLNQSSATTRFNKFKKQNRGDSDSPTTTIISEESEVLSSCFSSKSGTRRGVRFEHSKTAGTVKFAP